MKEILKSLKSARKLAQKEIVSIQDQISRINQAIDVLDPKPEIIAKPTSVQFKAKILEATSHDPLTVTEIRHRVGFMSNYRAQKYLKELTDEGKLNMLGINGVTHYRKPREELRLIAGHGVTSHKIRRRA